MKAFNRHDYKQSYKLLSQLSAQNPENNLYRFNLCNTLMALERFTDAATCFQVVGASQSPLNVLGRYFNIVAFEMGGEIWEASRLAMAFKNLPNAMAPKLKILKENLSRKLLQIGLSDYEKDQFENALKAFRLANDLNPTTEAQTAISMCLVKLKKEDEAKAVLNNAVRTSRSGQMSSSARKLLESLISAPPRTEEVPPFSVEAELALGYDSNVFGDGNRIDGRSEAQLQLGANRFIPLTKHLSLTPDYSYNQIEVATLPEARFQNHALRAPVALSQLPGKFEFGIGPMMQWQFYSGESAIIKPGAQSFIRWASSKIYLDLALETRRHHIQNDRYSYLQGYYQSARLGASSSIGPLSFYGGYYLIKEDLDDVTTTDGFIPLAYWARGPVLMLRLSLTDKLDISGQYLYLVKNYDHDAQPLNIKRVDIQMNMAFRTRYTLSSSVGIFGSVDWLDNQSTLDNRGTDNKNYIQLVTLVGVDWKWTQ